MKRMGTHRTLIIGSSVIVALALAVLLTIDAYVHPRIRDPFTRTTAGLSPATHTQVVELQDGASFDLRAGMVRKRIGSAEVKMLAYNGSVPGPTLKVTQGALVTITVTNALDHDTTVHWHGIRLENRFDGAPHDTQAPIPVGGSFSYRLRFPDAGIYWYHPHVREDYAQELGLYGNILVVPRDAAYWAPVNRAETLVLDDILMENGMIAAFSRSQPNHTAMGRFGNVMLINGETAYHLAAQQGEIIRFYVTNTANTRLFNLRLPGARMKLVGSDSGRFEHETFVDEVLVAPSERAVVDVFFDQPGQVALAHRTPEHTYVLGTVTVGTQPAAPSFATDFASLRTNAEFAAERMRLAGDVDRPADKTLALVGDMAGMSAADGDDQHGGLEWEDKMNVMNRRSSPQNMVWQLVDQETGAANHAIDWRFQMGERVKLRIVNEAQSDHPMQHPFHLHGQRFLLLSRDGVQNTNLAWKDSVLVGTGETVDILVDMSNPGVWMAHCHIAEHIESDMMLSFHVDDPAATTHDDQGTRAGTH